MRITRFLKADVFKEEFAHTLLHNQNVFEEFRKITAQKKADDERKEKDKVEQARLAEERKLQQ